MNAHAAKNALQGLVEGGGKEVLARTEIDKTVDDQSSAGLEQISHRAESLLRHQVHRRGIAQERVQDDGVIMIGTAVYEMPPVVKGQVEALQFAVEIAPRDPRD